MNKCLIVYRMKSCPTDDDAEIVQTSRMTDGFACIKFQTSTNSAVTMRPMNVNAHANRLVKSIIEKFVQGS